MHEILVKSIFSYIVVAGAIGMFGNIYRAMFLSIDASLKSPNKTVRLIFKYFIFSASYAFSYLLVVALVLYPLVKNTNIVAALGAAKYYFDYVITVPFAMIVAHLYERTICRVSPAA